MKVRKDKQLPFRKEEGFGGVEAIIMAVMAVISLWLIYNVNTTIVNMGWKGFVTNMQPDYLYPPFDGGYGSYPGHNVLSAAIYLQQNVVMKYIVNSLFFLILLFVGLAYIYSDLFEQHFGKLKTMLPRVVFGLVLAYTSLYIVEALMIISKAGYLMFYNLSVFNSWKQVDYIMKVAPEIRLVSSNSPFAQVNQVANMYWHYLWVFIIMAEALSLLVFVAFRMVFLAMLIVILPIGSILLIHPWTQSIGSRLWWLAISLIFIPIVMIIPLMLSTVIGNSVAFFIASLTAILGSIYLLAKEPAMLSGAGFQKAGNLLTGGVVGGGAAGNMITSVSGAVGKGISGKLFGGIMDKALDKFIDKGLDKALDKVFGDDKKSRQGQITIYSYSVSQTTVNISGYAMKKGGLEK